MGKIGWAKINFFKSENNCKKSCIRKERARVKNCIKDRKKHETSNNDKNCYAGKRDEPISWDVKNNSHPE